MAISIVGTPVKAAIISATSVTLTKNVTAGNALILLSENGSDTNVSSVKEDTTPFTADYVAPMLSAAEEVECWRLQSAGGASDTITVTFSGTTYGDVILYEVSGLDPNPFDSAFKSYATVTSGTTVTVTSAAANAVANSLLLTMLGDGTNVNTTNSLSSGWTLDWDGTGTGSPPDGLGVGHKIVSASAVQSCTFTMSGTNGLAEAIIVAYKGAAVAGLNSPTSPPWST
jgi:hypothetical protein